MIKRSADWLWRCAGAISPGMINCSPANNEPVIPASPLSPGFISIKTRRVASIALISPPDSIRCGRISRYRQMAGRHDGVGSAVTRLMQAFPTAAPDWQGAILS